MSAELIAIVAVGISLAGLVLRLHVLANRRIDRLEDRFDRQDDRFDRQDERLDRQNDRLATIQQHVTDRFGLLERGMADLRERMARLEGLIEGLRDAIGRAVA